MKREAVAVAVVVGYALAVIGFCAYASRERTVSISGLPGKLWDDVRESVKNARN